MSGDSGRSPLSSNSGDEAAHFAAAFRSRRGALLTAYHTHLLVTVLSLYFAIATASFYGGSSSQIRANERASSCVLCMGLCGSSNETCAIHQVFTILLRGNSACKRRSRSAALAEVRSADPEV
jgi:hypothetical protein